MTHNSALLPDLLSISRSLHQLSRIGRVKIILEDSEWLTMLLHSCFVLVGQTLNQFPKNFLACYSPPHVRVWLASLFLAFVMIQQVRYGSHIAGWIMWAWPKCRSLDTSTKMSLIQQVHAMVLSTYIICLVAVLESIKADNFVVSPQ